MKLEKVIIENFRGYKKRMEVDLDNLTAFIGKNDVGKSTILEALEIFFNNESVKIEPNDACVYGSDQKVRIGCVFSQIPHTPIIIDSSAKTSLEQEYLLNDRGLLEIHKIFDCSKKKPTEEVFAVAEQFEYTGDNLLELTQNKLKGKVEEYEVPDKDVNLSSNVSMRQAIYQQMRSQNLAMVKREIKLKNNDAKSVWEKIKDYLPIYSLFQSDRPSLDGDSEVQSPLKLAIQEALDSQQEKLNEIQKEVETYALNAANHTVDKIKEMDEELANQLLPRFVEDPKWPSIFKLKLSGDNEIPINKRGSGVRRLILLNFFRAEAERKRNNDSNRGVIYAIEEPETSQHPDNQQMLVNAFRTLAEESESQILLTTHVPGFAGTLPTNSIRYIKNTPEKVIVSYKDQENVLEEVSEALGILPSINSNKVKALVFVEGIHDVEALKDLSNIICQHRDDLINLSDTEEVVILPAGGSTLKGWVENRYLQQLQLPEIHIYDRDLDDPPKYQKYVDQINTRHNCFATLTKKREMENYIHPAAIEKIWDIKVETEDFMDIPTMVAQKVHEKNSQKPWRDVDEHKARDKKSKIKKRLNREAFKEMTQEQLLEMDHEKEVENWMIEIRNMCNLL